MARFQAETRLSDPLALRLKMARMTADTTDMASAAERRHPDGQAQRILTRNITRLLEFSQRAQGELARHVGISQPYMSLLLSGKRPWRIEMLDRVADFFVVSVPALFVESEHGPERRSGVERRVRGERRRL